MPRRHTPKDKYTKQEDVAKPITPVNTLELALKIPSIVMSLDTSVVKAHQEKPDWKLYRIEIRDEVPYIVREMCDRCGKVWIPPRNRKLRLFKDKTIGNVYLETGICNDCINAGVYVDKYLDGDVLSEKEAKELFYKYADDYERAWRMVLAAAPQIPMTEKEWQHRCKFFNGCAVCGGPIEVRAKYFPVYLNGAHTAWNVIPLCSVCLSKHYAGRVTKGKEVRRYKIFASHSYFNRSKTIRMYLLHEMEVHGIYMQPLEAFRKRFFEAGILEGSQHNDTT